MIELGHKIAAGPDIEQFNSSAITKTALVEVLLPVAAELQLRGSSPADLITPLVEQIDALETLACDREKQEALTVIQHDLADKFTSDEQKLEPEHFSVLPITKNGVPLFYSVVLTTPVGLVGNTFDEIMADNDENIAAHSLKVEGNEFDTRSVMNINLHRRMATLAFAAFSVSKLERKQPVNNQRRSYTWHTGDKNHPSILVANGAYDDELNPKPVTRSRTGRWSTAGWRPGVTIRA